MLLLLPQLAEVCIVLLVGLQFLLQHSSLLLQQCFPLAQGLIVRASSALGVSAGFLGVDGLSGEDRGDLLTVGSGCDGMRIRAGGKLLRLLTSGGAGLVEDVRQVRSGVHGFGALRAGVIATFSLRARGLTISGAEYVFLLNHVSAMSRWMAGLSRRRR